MDVDESGREQEKCEGHRGDHELAIAPPVDRREYGVLLLADVDVPADLGDGCVRIEAVRAVEVGALGLVADAAGRPPPC